MPEQEVISLDVDFTKKAMVIRKADGSLWLSYVDTEGTRRQVPISLIGLGDLLGSRVTLSGLEANLVEPKDINRFITSMVPTGRVFLADDMEHTTELFAGEGDTGGAQALVNTRAARGDKCLKITTATGVNKYWLVSYNRGLPPDRRLGLEIYWNVDTAQAPKLDRLGFNLQWQEPDTGVWYDALLWLIPISLSLPMLTAKWAYRSGENMWANVTDVPAAIQTFYCATSAWHWMKMIVDFSQKRFVKLITNGKVFDLSACSLPTGIIPTDTNEIVVKLIARCTGGASDSVITYFDDLIATCFEP